MNSELAPYRDAHHDAGVAQLIDENQRLREEIARLRGDGLAPANTAEYCTKCTYAPKNGDGMPIWTYVPERAARWWRRARPEYLYRRCVFCHAVIRKRTAEQEGRR